MNHKIVIIDDETTLLEFLQTQLTQRGFEVHTATDGQKGFELIEKVRPALVLLDLLLPKIHGFDLCRRIKADPALADVAVVMMTSIYKSVKYQYEGMRYGAKDFLHKPFELEALLEKIGRYVQAERPRVEARKLSPAVQAGLEALRRQFAEELPLKATEISVFWETLLQEWDAAAAKELYTRVHNLAGTGASFGFPEVSTLAREVEELLDPLLGRDKPPPAADAARIHKAISILCETATAAGMN
jgi:DNA-binding response OmpR family regulator